MIVILGRYRHIIGPHLVTAYLLSLAVKGGPRIVDGSKEQSVGKTFEGFGMHLAGSYLLSTNVLDYVKYSQRHISAYACSLYPLR